MHLRVQTLLLLFIVGFIYYLFFYQTSRFDLESQFKQQAKEQVKSLLFLSQSVISEDLKNNNIEHIQRILVNMASTSGLAWARVLNDESKVIASSRRGELGLQIIDWPQKMRLSNEQATKTKDAIGAVVNYDSVQDVYHGVIKIEWQMGDEVRPEGAVWLVVAKEMNSQLSWIESQISLNMFEFIVVIVFTNLLILGFIEVRFMSRLDFLNSSVQEFSEGKADLEMNLSGKDEISLVNKAVHDLANKKERADEKLIEQSNAFQQVLEASKDAIVIVDGKGVVTYFSPAAVRVFEIDESNILGKKIHEVIPFSKKYDKSGLMQNFLKNNTTKVVGEEQEVLALKPLRKHKFPVKMSVVEIVLEGTSHFACFLRDISQEKKAEQDLNDALLKANAGNQVKSEFLSMIHHELKTPLNGILGGVDILLLEDREDKGCYELIKRSAHKMSELINNLLDFVSMEKLEANKDVDPLICKDFLRDNKSFCESLVVEAGKTIDVSVAIEIEEKFIYVNITKVSLILHHLIRNAVKFSESGKIYLSMQVSDEEDKRLFIDVKDEGKGIKSENHNVVFDTFFQEDSSISRGFEGSGMGLSLAKKISWSIGGDLILFRSIPNEGSHFRLILPFIDKV